MAEAVAEVRGQGGGGASVNEVLSGEANEDADEGGDGDGDNDDDDDDSDTCEW